MKQFLKPVLGAVLLALSALPVAAQGSVLWGAQPFVNAYHSINQTTGAFITTQVVTLPGFTVNGILALTVDPTSGNVYIIAKAAGARRLAVLNLATGAATDVGAVVTNLSSLAFTTAGVLYATTGNGTPAGSGPPETLFTLNKATAAATLVVALGNGADGEVIAYNPLNGLMYHWSGNATNVFESINLTTLAVTNIPQSGAAHREVFGAVWNGSSFFISDIDSNLLTQTTAGASTLIGTAAADFRGMALIFLVTQTAVPTLGVWGMLLLAALLAMFGAYQLRRRGQAA